MAYQPPCKTCFKFVEYCQCPSPEQIIATLTAERDAAVLTSVDTIKRFDDLRAKSAQRINNLERGLQVAARDRDALRTALNHIGHGEINATSAEDALRQVVDYARQALAGSPASGGEGETKQRLCYENDDDRYRTKPALRAKDTP